MRRKKHTHQQDELEDIDDELLDDELLDDLDDTPDDLDDLDEEYDDFDEDEDEDDEDEDEETAGGARRTRGARARGVRGPLPVVRVLLTLVVAGALVFAIATATGDDDQGQSDGLATQLSVPLAAETTIPATSVPVTIVPVATAAPPTVAPSTAAAPTAAPTTAAPTTMATTAPRTTPVPTTVAPTTVPTTVVTVTAAPATVVMPTTTAPPATDAPTPVTRLQTVPAVRDVIIDIGGRQLATDASGAIDLAGVAAGDAVSFVGQVADPPVQKVDFVMWADGGMQTSRTLGSIEGPVAEIGLLVRSRVKVGADAPSPVGATASFSAGAETVEATLNTPLWVPAKRPVKQGNDLVSNDLTYTLTAFSTGAETNPQTFVPTPEATWTIDVA